MMSTSRFFDAAFERLEFRTLTFFTMNDEIREFIAENHQLFKSAKELHAILQEEFPSNNISYSTVTREIRKFSWSEKALSSSSKPGPEPDQGLMEDILTQLESEPGLSANQLAARLRRAPSTVRFYLRRVLGFEFKKTRWTPHTLTAEEQLVRVESSRALLDTLERAKRDNFRFFLTGDESWFFYSTPNKGLWMPGDAEPPRSQKPTHYAPKLMITIFWNTHGAMLVEALPAGEKWTAQYFIDRVIEPITTSELFEASKKQKRPFIIHMDNAPIHRAAAVSEVMEEKLIQRARHPPYSPDLAPSDFYLFGKLKSRLSGTEFRSSDEIVEWIRDEFAKIPRDELKRVFTEWERRLKRCIELYGGYIE